MRRRRSRNARSAVPERIVPPERQGFVEQGGAAPGVGSLGASARSWVKRSRSSEPVSTSSTYPGAFVRSVAPSPPSALLARRRRPGAPRGRAPRRVTPEVVDQPLGRHDAIRVQKQEREEGALLTRTQVDLDPSEYASSRPSTWKLSPSGLLGTACSLRAASTSRVYAAFGDSLAAAKALVHGRGHDKPIVAEPVWPAAGGRVSSPRPAPRRVPASAAESAAELQPQALVRAKAIRTE